jgi:hypothetical protein
MSCSIRTRLHSIDYTQGWWCLCHCAAVLLCLLVTHHDHRYHLQGLKGYRITISPLTDPPNTYYEAVGGGGFYTGIQICGGTCGNLGSNRQLIFSTWDEGNLNASLVSKGNMVCGIALLSCATVYA